MKIALVNFWTLRMRRGVETMVVSLANALAERGVEASILTAQQTQTPLVAPSPRVRVRQFPTFRYFEFSTIAPLYALDLLRNRYDVVVAFFADFGEGPALRMVSSFVHPRLFLYLTFPYESAPHRYHAYRQWGWDKRAEQILADAGYTARCGQEFFHRPVTVLPSGTNPQRFAPDADQRRATRRELGLRDDEIVLLNVSALEPRKGIWRMIEALPRVRAECPNVRYLILGEGPHKAHLLERVNDLGQRDTVIFAGTTTELPRYYNAADIFVMLSDSEAGSVACLEAMASGLPAVVSETGGFAEVVSAASGRLVNMDDHEAIAGAILDLAHNAELRTQLGAAARATVIEKFSWERIAEQLLNRVRSGGRENV